MYPDKLWLIDVEAPFFIMWHAVLVTFLNIFHNHINGILNNFSLDENKATQNKCRQVRCILQP